ncbi:hypothetical protein [Methylobacterium sp. sgz302541]|uniref:hypothetical protein n=1 Tax=unclassified Methylobacterium TaxID=2615210 RepID=UPI003D3263C6
MRFLAIAATCTALLAGPALAAGGNADQPNQPTPQTGKTSGGPRDNAPGMTTGTVKAPAGTMMRSGSGATDSAKGGNAAEPSKPVPNTGSTSGGPAR